MDEELLKKIEYALLNPVFPLYLGRRSCPPTGRLCLGIRKLELEEALLEEEFRNESIETVRIVMDAKKEKTEILLRIYRYPTIQSTENICFEK